MVSKLSRLSGKERPNGNKSEERTTKSTPKHNRLLLSVQQVIFLCGIWSRGTFQLVHQRIMTLDCFAQLNNFDCEISWNFTKFGFGHKNTAFSNPNYTAEKTESAWNILQMWNNDLRSLWNFPLARKVKRNNLCPPDKGCFFSGGRYRTRTCDPPHVKRMLIPAELIVQSKGHYNRYPVPCQ